MKTLDRSGIRYAAAACLIAIGLLVGGAAGIAKADPANPYRGNDGTSQGPGKPHTNDGFTRGPIERPKTRIGSGRDDATQQSGQSDGTKGSLVKPPKSDGDNPGGKPVSDDPGNLCPPGFPFPFPLLHRHSRNSWTGFDYFDRLTQYRPPAVPSWPFFPQAERKVSPSLIGQEPVIDTQPGGGGVIEPEVATGAEPPVLEAPMIVVPPGASVPPAVVPPPAAPAGPGLTGPGAAGEPVGGAAPPIVQSGPPLRGAPPGEPGAAAPTGAQSAVGATYGDYLGSGGLGQLALAALPGIGGILILTAGGGFIGYRQAKAGHSVRTRTAGRFLD